MGRHLAIILQILLIAKDEEGEVGRVFGHTLFKEILLPTIQVIKTLKACQVKH